MRCALCVDTCVDYHIWTARSPMMSTLRAPPPLWWINWYELCIPSVTEYRLRTTIYQNSWEASYGVRSGTVTLGHENYTYSSYFFILSFLNCFTIIFTFFNVLYLYSTRLIMHSYFVCSYLLARPASCSILHRTTRTCQSLSQLTLFIHL